MNRLIWVSTVCKGNWILLVCRDERIYFSIRAAMSENVPSDTCPEQRCRSDFVFVQSGPEIITLFSCSTQLSEISLGHKNKKNTNNKNFFLGPL